MLTNQNMMAAFRCEDMQKKYTGPILFPLLANNWKNIRIFMFKSFLSHLLVFTFEGVFLNMYICAF